MSVRKPHLDAADKIRIRGGRKFPYTTVGDWVLMSGVSSRAVHVYTLLRMHVNTERGDEKVWPSQATLAAMVGVKKYDVVAAAIKELVSIGAVEVLPTKKGANGRRNEYVVHEAPPEGYAGPVGQADWYRARGLLDD